MQTETGRFTRIVMTLLLPALLLLAGCGSPAAPRTVVDVAPFIEMAKDANCADVQNRVFVIDDGLVFWDVAGNCEDASYAQTLYGTTPDQVLCTVYDSIAGRQQECQDEQYRDMFETITSNLDTPDLGLGAEHTVEEISW